MYIVVIFRDIEDEMQHSAEESEEAIEIAYENMHNVNQVMLTFRKNEICIS